MYSIKKVLIERDGISEEEADELIDDAKELVADGADPEEVCLDEFGLEPDYVWDLLDI
jgi:hypothetical protein